MGYSYRKESRFFFLILSILFSSFIFSVFYFFQIFGSSLNDTLPFIFSMVILIFLLIVGIFNSRLTIKFYSFISKPRNLSQIISRINLDESEQNIQKMITRFKEVFYNLDLSDKKESILTIKKTVGFDDESALKVYKILKHISFTKNILTISGLLISVIIYFILIKVDFFFFLKQTKFFPITISLLFFLIFLFESALSSKIPSSFYLNLVVINKNALKNNLDKIKKKEEDLNQIFKHREDLRENIKQTIFSLTKKGLKKSDILEIVNSRKKEFYGLKDLIMQSSEDFSPKESKISFNEVSKDMDEILKYYENIKNKEKEIVSLKDKINEIKDVQETIEKINSQEWDYYKHIKLNLKRSKESEKNISDEIYSKLHHRSELMENKADVIKELYNLFVKYKDSITKDKVYSFLISKGYCYETIMDLFDEFKKNNIDLNKNKVTVQDKIISKINGFYDSFRD